MNPRETTYIIGIRGGWLIAQNYVLYWVWERASIWHHQMLFGVN